MEAFLTRMKEADDTGTIATEPGKSAGSSSMASSLQFIVSFCVL
jgi:hypothetical protein